MKTGLILEGGAVRGIFTAGVLDRLMENGVYFPYVIGVSAGGGNAMSYVSKQKGRTRNMINVPRSESYYGFRQLLESKRLINLDKMAYEYPYKQFPFDFDTYFNSGIFTEYVCTCMETGEAEYFTEENDCERLLTICKASCSVPMLCEPVEMEGKHYLDGSIADSIPIERALDMGCDKLVIILTKPDSATPPTDYAKFRAVIHSMYKHYPAFEEACLSRVERYWKNVRLMEELEEQGRIFVFRPTLPAISKFEKDHEKIMESYRDGYTQADDKIAELMHFMKSVESKVG
ncbi:MAG: patatin family protein [Oscillospiraceae bacterium]|nr:patatin family protein [Oscillospiraceae bacterium]